MEIRAEKVQVERRWGPATAGCDGGGQKAMQKGTKFEGGRERRVAATVRCQSAVESPHRGRGSHPELAVCKEK